MPVKKFMQISFADGMNFPRYQKIKARDTGTAISINTVSCRRKMRAYHASFDLADEPQRISCVAREDEEAFAK